MSDEERIGRCPEHGLPLIVCNTAGPCARERRKVRALERLARKDTDQDAESEVENRVRDGGRLGGKNRWKDKPSVEATIKLLREFREQFPTYKAWPACKWVAEKQGMDPTTILRRMQKHAPRLRGEFPD